MISSEHGNLLAPQGVYVTASGRLKEPISRIRGTGNPTHLSSDPWLNPSSEKAVKTKSTLKQGRKTRDGMDGTERCANKGGYAQKVPEIKSVRIQDINWGLDEPYGD